MKAVGSEMPEPGGGVGGIGAEIYSEFPLLQLNPQSYTGIVRETAEEIFLPH